MGQDPGGFSRIFNSPEAWTKVHEKIHPESASTYVELKLDEPLVLKPKDRRGIYIHSARPDDEGIVYDNSRLAGQAENGRLVIRPNGMAHLNPEPFNDNDPYAKPTLVCWQRFSLRSSRPQVGLGSWMAAKSRICWAGIVRSSLDLVEPRKAQAFPTKLQTSGCDHLHGRQSSREPPLLVATRGNLLMLFYCPTDGNEHLCSSQCTWIR